MNGKKKRSGRPRKDAASLVPVVAQEWEDCRDLQELHQWWQQIDLAELRKLKGVSLYRDLNRLVVRHLVLRLLDDTAPAGEKDRIALAIMPKMSTELRGALPTGSDGEVGELLGAYRIRSG